MRILYHHRTRGTDAQRVHIMEMVEAFRELGHQVRIVSLVGEEDRDDARRDASDAPWKTFVRRLPYAYEIVQLAYNPVGIALLVKCLFSAKADFIYERYGLLNFAGVLVARCFRIPIILEVNSPFALEQGRDGDIRATRLAAAIERWICNSASHVIVVSGSLKKILSESGVKPDGVSVVVNGVNLNHIRPSGNGDLRRALGLENRIVVGFVGWFREWHGLDLLLQAFRQCRQRSPSLRLLLVGDGPAMPGLRQFIEEHALEEDVVLTGPLPRSQVARYIDLLDVAVQPAANEYCCPMKILEYMALAKPIVAPRQQNIQELVADGEQALLFSPRDVDSLALALTTLAANHHLREEMGRNAAETIRSRDLTWRGNAERVLGLLKPRLA